VQEFNAKVVKIKVGQRGGGEAGKAGRFVNQVNILSDSDKKLNLILFLL
jgi:hypothetical protein